MARGSLGLLAAFLGLALAALLTPAGAGAAKITLSGMPVYETYPLLVMTEQGSLGKAHGEMEFVPWNNPDQMRALVAGGQADFFVLPTNVALKLHSNGIKVKLLLVSLSSSLWIISAGAKASNLEGIKGGSICMPFRGDMPETVFSLIARGLGMNPKRDFNLRYAASPMDALQQLLLGRVDYAFLAEPVISAAMQRMNAAQPQRGPGKITRAVDMQKQWARAYPQGPDMMLGAIAAAPPVSGNRGLLRRFCIEYQKALAWCQKHPQKTGRLVERRFPFIKARAVAAAVKSMDFKAAKAADVKTQLKRFLEITAVVKPGAKRPDIPIDEICWRD